MHPITRFFNHLQRKDFLLMLRRPAMGAQEAALWYPVWVYEMMETDEVRDRQYRAVIDRHVRGKVVLELGTGRKALWAGYCAERGAERVYAVEANRRSFESSKACVERRGLTRVTVLHGFSDAISLPERCDVLMHDLVGSIGSREGMVPFIRDAKARLLTEGAVHIPHRCQTFFFPTARPRHTAAEAAFNLLARRGRPISSLPMVLMYGHRPAAMLAEPQVFEDFVFPEALPVGEERTSEFTVVRDGLWEAFAFFIRLFVDRDHVIDSLASRTNWCLPYVRPFPRPVRVREGNVIRVESATTYRDATPTYRLVCRLGAGGSFEQVADHTWSGA